MISAAENSNKFQKKTRFWKEKSVEGVVTLGPTAKARLVYTPSRKSLGIQFGAESGLLYKHGQNDALSE